MSETDVALSGTDENIDVIDVVADTSEIIEDVQAEESSTSENESGETGEDTTAEPKKGVQKRIDELTAKRKEAERERDYYRQQLEESRQPKQEVIEPVKPVFADFDYDSEKFARAMDDYADKKASWSRHQEAVQVKQRETALEQQRKEWDYQSKSAKFAKDNTDYFETVGNPELRISTDMATVIKDSEHGPALAYYLGKNPGIAAEISYLPPHRQYMEMGKLEVEIVSRKAPERQLSNAPKPITPLGSKSTVKTDPAEMTDKQFAEWRRSQISKRS